MTKGNRPPLPTRIFYFHNDLNGAPEELTDEHGEIIWQTTYKVWGNTIQEEHQASSLTRQIVEHAFARLTHQGGKCLRTIGLARARVVIGLKMAMHNLLLMARIAQLGTGAPA